MLLSISPGPNNGGFKPAILLPCLQNCFYLPSHCSCRPLLVPYIYAVNTLPLPYSRIPRPGRQVAVEPPAASTPPAAPAFGRRRRADRLRPFATLSARIALSEPAPATSRSGLHGTLQGLSRAGSDPLHPGRTPIHPGAQHEFSGALLHGAIVGFAASDLGAEPSAGGTMVLQSSPSSHFLHASLILSRLASRPVPGADVRL